MKISIAQIDSVIGDFTGNADKIINFSRKAAENKAELVLFPELAICGYPPMDLLDQDIFVEKNIRTLRLLQQKLDHGIAVGVGYVNRNVQVQGKALVNAYGFILDGELVFEQTKTLLPTYDVFDEARNFEPAREWKIFPYKGERIGVAICEDVWRETETPGTKYCEDPVRRLLDRGASILAVPSASPFFSFKHKTRLKLTKRICERGGTSLIYINSVGANDSIIFDGRSFFMSPGGSLTQAAAFEEDIVTVELKGGAQSFSNATCSVNLQPESTLLPPASAPQAGLPLPPLLISGEPGELDILEQALILGIRSYMQKCGFKKAHLGLSGGIDSALAAYLAVRASGAENIVCISMPSRFSSQGSKDDAAELAANLGCRYETIPIEPVYSAFLDSLHDVFENRPFDIAEENLQARIRGTLLMGFSNKWNSMQITTGNKSELAMGYCTLYGDMNGALGPIGDLFKTEVFALCRRINENAVRIQGKPVIPPAILEKPPSAELRPNQKDQDSLPEYAILDEILSLYLFNNLSADEIAERGFSRELAASIIKTCARAEFKRRQAPPVLKVSPRAFGMGRRMPIARSLYEV
ncbi:MAG: NAD+ synthase [Spirochaetaceae bacterium]|jgi:NAD+ synthase (glutamine-hydrolysing)|nr:NAD+ synthase [Spirochaetaceae bacterium]